MSEISGFKRIVELNSFKAAVLDEPSDEFISLRSEEVTRAVDFAQISDTLEMSAGLMDLGWRWVSMNPQNLSEAVEEQRAWWWQGGEGLMAIREDDWQGESVGSLMFAASELEWIPEMLVDFRKLAASLGFDRAA